MRKTLITTALLATTFGSSLVSAADWYPGQTGQYHLVPQTPDTQYLTLVGRPDPKCASGFTLFAVDEWGKAETIPFVVPASTVFLLTDAVFRGSDSNPFGANAGLTPWLNIAQVGPINPITTDRASFLASKQLSGKAGEWVVGQGSVASGVAYPLNSMFCAYLSTMPDSFDTTANITLANVMVHGKLVTNYRTNNPPFFTW